MKSLATCKIKLHRLVGASISHWSSMEGSLVTLASWIMDVRSEKVGLVFYSINNFHTWLSIIDELFEIDPAFVPLRPEWNKIMKKLRELNDTRVRLAHHSVEKGTDVIEVAQNDADYREAFPFLGPNENDVRAKWKKKKSIGLDEIATFYEGVTGVIEELTSLMQKVSPIFLGPKRRLVVNVRELQRKAKLWDEYQKNGS